ncbi:MAG: FAD:protein FMN transferase [Acidimicrobiia bacterium]|nr:FAD:protein FMN transferase [Acidimicrobiia bacterium]
MGTTAHVVVLGGAEPLLDLARARLDELERRWSRFQPGSEICRLNAAQGRPVRVSADTVLAVRTAIAAWKLLNGAFDPTVLDALEQAGYDRTFAEIPARAPAPAAEARAIPIVPGCAGIEIDPLVRAITLPAHVRLDLGGIGKGLAADLVAESLIGAGAAGALVNVGGDLRVAGASPHPFGWTVDLDHAPGGRVALTEGGLATSATTKRRWQIGNSVRHHVIDPTTGTPAQTGVASATVIARRAVDAETLATAALTAGMDDGIALLEAHDASGLLIDDQQERRATQDLGDLVGSRR